MYNIIFSRTEISLINFVQTSKWTSELIRLQHTNEEFPVESLIVSASSALIMGLHGEQE